MRCPRCKHEPRDRLLHKPCPACGHIWWDTESYVNELSKGLDVKTVLDIGCGTKGVIGQHHWENVVGIEAGYACDIHVVKDLPPLWTPLVMDAVDLVDRLGEKSIDFLTHCGMLEHVEYRHALKILHTIERLVRQRVFFTCSAIVREVDYKVRRDGNPYHYYRSFWDPNVFYILGYHVDVLRMLYKDDPMMDAPGVAPRPDLPRGHTFTEETTGWFDPDLIKEPWAEREAKALRYIRDRRCHAGCEMEPVGWKPHDGIICMNHRKKLEDKGPLGRWLDNPNRTGEFPYPPGRDPLPLVSE